MSGDVIVFLMASHDMAFLRASNKRLCGYYHHFQSMAKVNSNFIRVKFRDERGRYEVFDIGGSDVQRQFWRTYYSLMVIRLCAAEDSLPFVPIDKV